MSKIIFISGANRGIGLGMAHNFLAQGDTVIVGYRSAASSQSILANTPPNLHPFKIDVTDESDAADLHNFIEERFGRLDVLINNAGILIDRNVPLNELGVTDLVLTFNVNVGGTHLVTRNLYPLLVKSDTKQIVNISSGMASLAKNRGGTTAYRVSKTALNMLTSNQAISYKEDGVTAICVHPGWVQSDMGGQNADLTVQEAADYLTTLVNGLTFENNGAFLNYDGAPIAW